MRGNDDDDDDDDDVCVCLILRPVSGVKINSSTAHE